MLRGTLVRVDIDGTTGLRIVQDTVLKDGGAELMLELDVSLVAGIVVSSLLCLLSSLPLLLPQRGTRYPNLIQMACPRMKTSL